MMDCVIAWDLGTSGIKASLFSEYGVFLADVFEPYNTFYPAPMQMEQRPEDWWNRVCSATHALLEKSGVCAACIRAAALSGHSLVGVPFDAHGAQLLSSVPIWCDMRAADQAEELFSKLSYKDWYLTTGNGDPPQTYTLLKLMWMKKYLPEVYAKTVIILGSKDYINYRLTGQFATDPSYASGFGVFDLRSWKYKLSFAEAAGISGSIFPAMVPSDGVVGYVTAEASEQTGLPRGMPVACGAVDNTCMALGSTGLIEGSVYTSLGSSSWIAVTGREPILDTDTLPFVFAHARKGWYTSAVSIFSAGNSFRWARDQLCCDLGKGEDAYDRMTALAQASPVGSNGVLFNPTLAGGSSQEPGPELTGGFMGLTLRTTKADIVRSVMEGVALSLRCVMDILSLKTELRGNMLLSGGGSKSALWRQIFADVYHMPVFKTNVDQNAASLGAAALAANACGLWNGYDRIADVHRARQDAFPCEENAAYYEAILPVFREWTIDLEKHSREFNRRTKVPHC